MVNDYIALDVETTGLDPVRNRLLEIGAVKVQGRTVCGTYETLVDAGVPVPARIRELTGITDEMRRTGKRTEEAIRGFLEFRGELPVVGHNVSFDYGFLKQAAAEAGCVFETGALDTLKIARRVLPELPSRTLTAMCAYYGIDQGNAHRALDDARSAHLLLLQLWEAFGQADPGVFALCPLAYTAKKQSPITNSQKGYLKDLLKYHKIELDIQIDGLTKSEASRIIDGIILQYGRIIRQEGRRKNEFL